MSYENAPATKMLATRCACCSKKLVDAKSVECGVGPECRKKHGYEIDLPEDVRVRANSIVYQIALEQNGPNVVEKCVELSSMGMIVLAERILKRLKVIQITENDGVLEVKSPYDPGAVEDMRRIPGRRWNHEKKVNNFPVTEKRRLWEVLQQYYSGCQGVGPKGAFNI